MHGQAQQAQFRVSNTKQDIYVYLSRYPVANTGKMACNAVLVTNMQAVQEERALRSTNHWSRASSSTRSWPGALSGQMSVEEYTSTKICSCLAGVAHVKTLNMLPLKRSGVVSGSKDS